MRLPKMLQHVAPGPHRFEHLKLALCDTHMGLLRMRPFSSVPLTYSVHCKLCMQQQHCPPMSSIAPGSIVLCAIVSCWHHASLEYTLRPHHGMACSRRHCYKTHILMPRVPAMVVGVSGTAWLARLALTWLHSMHSIHAWQHCSKGRKVATGLLQLRMVEWRIKGPPSQTGML